MFPSSSAREEYSNCTSTDSAKLADYFSSGYSAVSHHVIDYWMPRFSGAATKVLLLVMRRTLGERECRRQGNLRVALGISEIAKAIGMNTQAVVAAIRELEENFLITAIRAHRKTTHYELQIQKLNGRMVDSEDGPFLASENHHLTERVDDENHSLPGVLDDEIHYQNGGLGSENHYPYKEIKAAAALPTRIQERDVGSGGLTPEELAEIQRIEQRTGVQIDRKDALRLKTDVERANLTLAHLRWFLRDERFASARSPVAVLLTIAREFRERTAGLKWPACLDDIEPRAMRPGLTGEEISLW